MSTPPARAYRAHALHLGSGFLLTHGEPGHRYRHGDVPTVDGYVSVYAEGFDGGATSKPWARWSFIHGGTAHELTDSTRSFTKRGLIRIARQFARAVVNGWPLP